MHKFFTILLFLTFVVIGFSQKTALKKKQTNKEQQLTVLPIVYFSPETNFAFGVGSVYQFKFNGENKKNYSSQISAGAIYTLNKQLLFYVPFNLYFKNNQHYVYGEIGYYDYVYPFFGIGIDARNNEVENYEVSFPKIELAFTKKFYEKFYFGPQLYFENYNITKTKENGLIQTKNLTGIDGGKISGLGLVVFYENRNNVYYPTKGNYLKLSYLKHNNYTFSNYNFNYFDIDFANFTTFFDDGILATNIGGFFTNGNVPLHRLALVGGAKKMRGYIKGRYRANNFIYFQNEYRRKLTKNIGAVAFVNFGYLSDDFKQIKSTQILKTYGFGLRYKLNKEGVNLRVDYAKNNETTGIYLTFGEAF